MDPPPPPASLPLPLPPPLPPPAPAPAPPVVPAAPAAPAARWRDLQGLELSLTVLFSVMVAASVLLAVALGNRIGVVRDMRAGELGNVVSRAQDADDFVGAASAIFAVTQLVIVVVFIIWLFRAAKNNEGLRHTAGRFSAGWAIGGWFVPIANLVIPVLIVQDLWRGADASRPRGDTAWRKAPGSVLIGIWWTAWVLSAVRFVASGSGFDSGSLSDIERSNTIALIGVVITGIAAVLALLVVRALSRRQLHCLDVQRADWDAAAREVSDAQ